jgi:putative transcriptional regulator
MIRHHPSDSTLIAHSMGALPLLHSRVLAAHLNQCQSCQSALRAMEEIGGAMLASLPQADLQADALARTLERLAGENDVVTPAEPDTLASLAVGRWHWIAPGIRLMPVADRDMTGTRLDLVRVSPGTALPTHDHGGLETTCVLQGSFNDGQEIFQLYDVAESTPGLTHTPTATAGPDCICLTATTARLRPEGRVARLVLGWFGL